jgi:hypothetical protein
MTAGDRLRSRQYLNGQVPTVTLGQPRCRTNTSIHTRTTTEKITVPSSTRLASIRLHLEPEFEPRPNQYKVPTGRPEHASTADAPAIDEGASRLYRLRRRVSGWTLSSRPRCHRVRARGGAGLCAANSPGVFIVARRSVGSDANGAVWPDATGAVCRCPAGGIRLVSQAKKQK